MFHAIRRLIVAYPNRAICCTGVSMMVAPFVLAMLMLSLFKMYEEGTFSRGLLWGVVSWLVSVQRYVAYTSWILGGVLILYGVVGEFRRTSPTGSSDIPLR